MGSAVAGSEDAGVGGAVVAVGGGAVVAVDRGGLGRVVAVGRVVGVEVGGGVVVALVAVESLDPLSPDESGERLLPPESVPVRSLFDLRFLDFLSDDLLPEELLSGDVPSEAFVSDEVVVALAASAGG